MATTVGKVGYRLDANFTEDVVGFALESFLAVISFPFRRFSIEPFSRKRERYLGADARLHGHRRIVGFRPFYMQFKRPSGYPNHSSSRIITDRKKLNLTVDPAALFFQLREKLPAHNDYQQNILFRLRNHLINRKLGDAAYVCPLFLDRDVYRYHVHLAAVSRWGRFWRHHPWGYEDILIDAASRTIRFDHIPIFAEHVTVPPHEKVSSAKHSYSFSERGGDACFHSPQSLPDGAQLLSIYLKQISRDFLADRGEELVSRGPLALQETIAEVLGENIPAEFQNISPDGDVIANWLRWGDFLHQEHDIVQYAFVDWGHEREA